VRSGEWGVKSEVLKKPHKNLEVWKKSVGLVKEVYALTDKFPRSELYALADQMRRAAVSIPSNIAEGAARSTKKEFIQFLHIAQGSLSELDTQFEVALSLEYLRENEIVTVSAHADEVDRMLTGLIKSLKRDS
jgi:four helix bundle protein